MKPRLSPWHPAALLLILGWTVAPAQADAQQRPGGPEMPFEIVTTHPILIIDPRARPAWESFVQRDLPPDVGRDALRALSSGGEGFGFAGEATDADRQALWLGLAAGLRPATESAGGEAKGWGAVLESLREQVGPSLMAPVAESLGATDTLGGVDRSLRATLTALGQAKGPATRRHGYLAVGLWTVLALIDALEGGKRAQHLAGMGAALARMLRQDARMGGADEALAARVEAAVAAIEAREHAPAKIVRRLRAVVGAPEQ